MCVDVYPDAYDQAGRQVCLPLSDQRQGEITGMNPRPLRPWAATHPAGSLANLPAAGSVVDGGEQPDPRVQRGPLVQAAREGRDGRLDAGDGGLGALGGPALDLG